MANRKVLGICILTLALLVFSMFFFIADINGWFDNNWKFRQTIELNTDSGSTPANYQINIILDSSNVGSNFNWSRNCDDLRFVNSDDYTMLDFWVQSCSSIDQNASIWIKIPESFSTSTKEIFMYYGNDYATSQSDGESTFDFFDDFESDLGKWTQHKNQVGITINSGYVEIGGGSTSAPYGHAVLGSNATYSGFTDGIIEGEVYLSANSIAEVGTRGDFISNTGYKSRMDARSGEGVSHLMPPYNDGSWNFLSGCSVTGGEMSTLTWIPFKVSVYGNQLTISSEGKSVTCTDSSYSSAGEISLQNHYGNYARYDNIRIRKYFLNNVIVNIGSEEGRPIIANDNVAQVYDQVLGQDGNLGPIAINLVGQNTVLNNFTHSTSSNPSRIYVNENGLYKISYACSWHSTGANNRLIMENWVRKNGALDIIPSKTSCYIRNTGDGNMCSNSGVLVSDLVAGDYIELIGDKLQGANGATVTYDDCFAYVQKVKNKVAQVYDNTGGQDFDVGDITVNMGALSYLDGDTFSVNPTGVSFLDSGYYKVYYHVCSESTGQNSRQTDLTWLRKNGVDNITPSFVYSYIRQTGDGDRNCNQGIAFSQFLSGDNVEVMHTKKDKEGTGSTITLANQNWMLVEKIESDSSMFYDSMGVQSILADDIGVISFDNIYKNDKYIRKIGDKFYFEKGGLYEISYNLGYIDGGSNLRTITCSKLLIDGIVMKPSQQCDYSRGDDQARWHSASANLIYNATFGEFLQVETTTIGNSITLEPDSSWISFVKLDEDNEVYWNSDELDVGVGTINEGAISANATITSYRENYDVSVNCISGNCSSITTSWSSYSFSDGESRNVSFFCDDSVIGDFNATFSVASNQDLTSDLINVSCSIFKVFGSLNVDLLDPIPLSSIQVGQNRTFNLRARVTCNGDVGTTCGNISALARYNKSIGQFGTGSDGSIVINSLDTVINDYSYTVGDELGGEEIITVANPTSFSIGDEILIIQMQNGSGIGHAGTYEFNYIKDISGFDLILEEPLTNDYGSGVFDTAFASATQIVRVPHFTTVDVLSGASITAPLWNGYFGGIVVFRASDHVDTQGYINVSEKGFRGGTCASCGNNDWGTQGEGITGVGIGDLGMNSNGGGGGYGPSGYGGEPGAGGGHATLGGTGISSAGFDAAGGGIVGSIELSRIFFGGGAGAGGDNDGKTPYPENIDGGGIAMVFSKNVSNARVHSRGETGIWPGSPGGSTGSGAGGSIWIAGNDVSLADVDAMGGPSVIAGSDIGGAGGDGRVRIDYDNLIGTSTPSMGYSGSLDTGSAMSKIPTSSSIDPLVSISSNAQSCGILNATESCIITWIINATGDVGSSHLVDVRFSSDKPTVESNATLNSTINITSVIAPEVLLINPINSSKIILNDTLEFTWYTQDDSSILNCSLFIDDNLVYSGSCNSYQNNSVNISVGSGFHEWNVEVIDEDGNAINSTKWSFTSINNKHLKIEKRLVSINDDLYRIDFDVIDYYNSNYTIIDFVENRFNYGSFSIITNWINITTGMFNGRILGWDLYGNFTMDYSITRNSDEYELLDEYIISLE